MASADQLKALLKSHLEGDDDRFFSVALQVAAHEAKPGHGKLAEELRTLIDEAKRFAERFTKTASRSLCLPVLFHGRSIHPKQHKTLNRAKVRFRGRQLTIKTARCCQPGNLACALSS